MKKVLKELVLVSIVLILVTSCGNKTNNKDSNLNTESESKTDKKISDDLETFMDSDITISYSDSVMEE